MPRTYILVFKIMLCSLLVSFPIVNIKIDSSSFIVLFKEHKFDYNLFEVQFWILWFMGI